MLRMKKKFYWLRDDNIIRHTEILIRHILFTNFSIIHRTNALLKHTPPFFSFSSSYAAYSFGLLKIYESFVLWLVLKIYLLMPHSYTDTLILISFNQIKFKADKSSFLSGVWMFLHDTTQKLFLFFVYFVTFWLYVFS